MIPVFYDKKLVEEALAFAENAHAGQSYGSRESYFVFHIKKVVDYLAEHNESNWIQVIGALHDIYEDTKISRKDIVNKFGVTVDGAIDILTRKNGENYFDYIRKLKIVDACKKVKLADLYCNYRASVIKGMKSKQERYSKAILILLGYAE